MRACTCEFILNSEVLNFLNQHPHRIFQELCQLLNELGCLRSIAHAVIHGDGRFHATAWFDLAFFHNSPFSRAEPIGRIAPSVRYIMASRSFDIYLNKTLTEN